jgi:1-carboxybiuret hydrolase subunit AtzG-like protein
LGAISHLPLRVREDGMGKEMSADMIDDYIASVGAALGLPIEDAWKGAVRANLEVSLRMARLVDEFPLPDEAEPASVFTA